ncbi:chaperonin containing t-complex protein 1, zeta subunit, tcpz [Reticulomyxa filosa]|uniref:Chaperonin containing t-complex protein 1, zeta subunit, tcpz n=1 Tax=Reticulomyxa filosa TaxID=46433 RepID=X6N6Z7_RETFI|nr:chaperonin containing t-complex protein 1, zeta subunit, tcpz [Reticulomyxa filosa]|eukprot:ETO21811.1 chaperonin containing t-complex protein 1, zeta subunit, tcpz [Reticulomyxa filosa]
MPAVHEINPRADVISKHHALSANIAAAKGMMNVLKSNLGPNGTLKMLVGGAGQIKLTKDGNVLLKEMQIQHPTAALIARTAVAQDDVTGDGTTSVVVLAGELLRQAERYIAEGMHPRVIVEGIELARDEAVKYLEESAVTVMDEKTEEISRELLLQVARTSLRTKLSVELADHLTDIVVDAVLTIRDTKREDKGNAIDLHMVEIMVMEQHSEMDTQLIRGLVLDHGSRHPDMHKRVTNCFILTCNISLEWEKTEVNSAFYWKNAEQREQMVAAERKHTNDKVMKIIELKKKVSAESQKFTNFVVINEKGIDPISLDLLQREGIIGIRRAKRRNMERIPLACGGYAVNNENDLTPDCLGYAGLVYEHQLGDDKFTFIEDVKNPFSCTILIRGPNKHTIEQVKDAVRDGLRAVKNTFDDKRLVYGAGAFEAQAYSRLVEFKKNITGKKKIGVQVFADALLAIPRILASNAGHDEQDSLLKLLDAVENNKLAGLDLTTGDILSPKDAGIYDNFGVKKQLLHLSTVISNKLLLVDEIIRAGRSMGKKE